MRQDTPALRRDRLLWADQNYFRDETLIACNVALVAAQNRIGLARTWGGGDVASADGMRFVVPVRTIHAGPNPKYFNRGRGVTWYNLLSDQGTGLNAITVPGTLQVDERPTRLAQAIAEIGRIDKTIHTLNLIDDEARRRGTLVTFRA